MVCPIDKDDAATETAGVIGAAICVGGWIVVVVFKGDWLGSTDESEGAMIERPGDWERPRGVCARLTAAGTDTLVAVDRKEGTPTAAFTGWVRVKEVERVMSCPTCSTFP